MFKLNLEPNQPKSHPGDQVFDVLIVGAGSAGLTTAVYTSRDGWQTLVLDKEAPGGLAGSTHWIENYPGFPDGVEGPELMDRFKAQAERFGAEITAYERVRRLEKNQAGLFELTTEDDRVYRARAVLLATGSEPQQLGIPGEDTFYNQGVSYCATCDGPLYKDQDVAVIGCGNSGLQEAQILLQYARSVTFVEYLDHSIAEQVLQDRVKSSAKSTCLLSHAAREIQGDEQVTGLVVENLETGREEQVDVSAVFIYIGYTPSTDFLEGFLDLDESGYIITDREMSTSVPGVYAAGDVRADNLAQVAVAVGDGAKAAVAIREYLQEQAPVPA